MLSGVKNRPFENTAGVISSKNGCKKPNWFLIIMSTAIAGARISHVSKNLTKLRAFKFHVSKFSIFTRSATEVDFKVSFHKTTLPIFPS